MKERPALEAALEVAEAALDQLGDHGFLTDIPVVGVAFKLCKTVSGVRERIYVSKLGAFHKGIDRVPNEERQKMLAKLLPDTDERQKIGERLIMILEQATDYEKPAIMAVYFVAYLRNMIDLPHLLRCWDAIENAYIGDLKILLGLEGVTATLGANSHIQYLLRTGLTTVRTVRESPRISATHVEYVVSDFGKLFIHVYHETNAA